MLCSSAQWLYGLLLWVANLQPSGNEPRLNEMAFATYITSVIYQGETWVSSPKNENSVINYSPSCLSKPIRPLFIFETQIKIFLMRVLCPSIDSKGTTTIKAQKCSKDVVKMWHQWFNLNFTKLREYFLCAKKTTIIQRFLLFGDSPPPL